MMQEEKAAYDTAARSRTGVFATASCVGGRRGQSSDAHLLDVVQFDFDRG